MPALVYLFVMFALGDSVGRRFYTFVSIPHRLASAFLCGLLLSSWWTYAAAYMFSGYDWPMLWGNIAFFITAGGLIFWLRNNPPKKEPHTTIDLSEGEFQRADWIIAGIFLLFATWMMFHTFTMGDGNIKIGHHQFPDFGSTLSIMQSFAEGHNFPTQYTHYTGERIRYHFLFYFQAGNLEFLGFSPAVANNILSIFSLTSLLLLVMTLGSVLFRSRVAGRIGAALFFFHGSLAFIPFLLAHPTFSSLLEELGTMKDFLKSGFPYRGEAWGVWSQNVYLNQRHLTSAIAIFVLILIYIVIRLREKFETETEPEISPDAEFAESEPDTSGVADEDEDEDNEFEDEDEEDGDEIENDEDESDDSDESASSMESRSAVEGVEAPDLSVYIKKYSILVFSGVLFGLLPMWNGAVFLGGATVLAAVFALFPRLRREIIAMGITTAVIALPQIIYLRTGNMKPVGYSMFHWGFVIEDAGIFDVLYWTFCTFGFKWVLLAIAIYFASGLQRRFLAAISILLPLTYCFRFAEEVLANHKFINMWLVVINVFCGFALVKLWNLKAGSSVVPARVAAVILALLVTVGGAIDLAPIWNSTFIDMKYDDNKLIKWVKESTDPKSIFLSHRYINHEILLAGRRLFYGDPYYAWGSDYDTETREALVRTMLESQDPNEVLRLLKENDIDYVAIDDQIRNVRQYIKNPNEALYAQYFPVAFSDDSGEFGGHMRIYKVPDDLSTQAGSTPPPSGDPADQSAPPKPNTNIFRAGTEGSGPGQFSDPRGLAVDAKGFVYVADYHNARIQKFAADGSFVSTFGTAGDGEGQMKEPNSIVVDEAGDLYVTDGLNHKLMKFDADGKFIKEWAKPAIDFYGARDLAFGPNKRLYIVDQGHTNVTAFDPTAGTFTTFGSAGAGDGQFNESTGIGTGAGLIFVADRDNHRIQVFDLEGKFIRQWPIPTWERSNFPDVVYDDVTKHVYVSNGKTNEIQVFDVEGNPLPPLTPANGEKLANPSAMVISETGKERKLFVLNTDGRTVTTIPLEAKKAETKKSK